MSGGSPCVLVTGAAGFIGSHLTERLVRDGMTVRAFVHYNSAGSWGWLDRSPVRDEVEVVQGDIADRDSVRGAVVGADIVFHLAALIAIPYSYRAPFSYLRTNVEGTLNVLEAVREQSVGRFVHTSTSEVYGTAKRVPIREDHPLQGQSPYAATKIAADKLAESFHLSFGVPVVTVRPFNTFGPRQSARAVVPTIITQALSRSEIVLGNLAPTRDLSFVADTVDGFVRAAHCDAAIGSVLNLGTGREISIGDLARTITRLTGTSAVPRVSEDRLRPEGSEVERLCADNSRALELLDWKPRYSLEDGLRETIDWVAEHMDMYRPEAYAV